MTARYAHLDDETVKREMDGFHERVNIRGERIALPVDGPLGEAAWMKERIARAKQALPNGYCGLPLVQSCPHPNACLSCDSFLTDGSFRHIHERQLAHTQTLRAARPTERECAIGRAARAGRAVAAQDPRRTGRARSRQAPRSRRRWTSMWSNWRPGGTPSARTHKP